jgi:hypothetical protein
MEDKRMKFKSRVVAGTLLSLVAMSISVVASATPYTVTGVPVRVFASWSTWSDGFDISGVGATGNCPLDNNGFLTVSINKPGTVGSIDPSGNRIFATALAAELAGKTLTIHVDDTVLDIHGQCLVEWIYM